MRSAVPCHVDVRGFSKPISRTVRRRPEALRSIERAKSRDAAPRLWGSVLGRVEGAAASRRGMPGEARPRLCLNWNNPLVRTLAATTDDAVFSRSIQLVYVQALLAGHRPLRAADRRMLTSALSDLVQLSVGLTGSTPADPAPSTRDE